MQIKINFKKSLFIFILLAGILAGSIGYASVNTILSQNMASAHSYPKNASGETYGSALDASSNEKEPDLIQAIGVDGTIGYVRATEMDGEMPKTPEEALAKQANEPEVREVPLYKSDGKTIIGRFEIKKSSTSITKVSK